MAARRDFSVLWKQVHHARSYLPSMTVLFAVAALALGVGVFLALPEAADTKPQTASATDKPAAKAPETTAVADESLCDKQAWPYIDQRCAQRVEAARGTREVRIVTDKGNSVTVKSPEPIVEAKPKPAPPAPAVAQTEKPIGPPVAPVAESPPQVEKVAAPQPQPQTASAPQNPAPQATPKPAPAPTVVSVTPHRSSPAPQNPAPQAAPAPAPAVQASVAPSETSTAPMAPGTEAFAESSKKSKSARAAERAEKRAAAKAARREARREARRQKALEQDADGAPEEAVATSSPADGQNGRRTRSAGPDRGRNGVPDEVVEAVEQAAASESRGRRGGQVVTIGSRRGETRIILVPRGGEIGGW